MKKLFSTKYLTMGVFLVYICVTFLLNLSPLYDGIRGMGYVLVKHGILNPTLVETDYINGFVGKNGYITGNGAIQRIIGARIVNERYMLENGHLSYIIAEYDMEGIAQNTVAFRDALQTLDIPFAYVNTPFKIHRTDKQLPEGIEDHSNENADRFLACLEKEDVTVLDLRDIMEAESLNHYDMFYKTDHHWTAEAGLWAAGNISGFLAEQDSDFGADRNLWDPARYEYSLYEDVFLGSSGRRVGPLYIGKDDFTLITPKFDTQFTFVDSNAGICRKGSFSDVFLFMENLYAEDAFLSNTYQVYCGANRGKMEITNHSIGEDSAADKKLLVIRDSYSDVLIPFLSLGYSQIHAVDLRSFDGNLMEYVQTFDPDMVLVVYNPGAYEDNNLAMFEFLQ